ncbi:hypothetical protein ACP4OV_001014 [Aristida adscensionis]
MEPAGFLPGGGAANGAGSNGAGGGQGQAPAIREQDRLMPIANVIRIMRRVLPAHAKISDDAKETIQECVSEYISFITGEANERCQREQRKTITAEDVLWAMSRLGFDDYVEPLSVYLQRYREFEGEARGVGAIAAAARGAGDHHYHHHHHHAVPPSHKPRAPPAVMVPHGGHPGDMQMHAAMYGGAAAAPPHHHGGFVMPPHQQAGHYMPYPYEGYGGEHATMAAYYGGAFAPGNNGGNGDGSGSSGSGSGGGSASHTPQGAASYEHHHPFAYK